MNSITDERDGDDRRHRDPNLLVEWLRWVLPILIGALCAYFVSQNAINVALEGKASRESVSAVQIEQAAIRANQANMKESLDRLSDKIERLPQQVVDMLARRR